MLASILYNSGIILSKMFTYYSQNLGVGLTIYWEIFQAQNLMFENSSLLKFCNRMAIWLSQTLMEKQVLLVLMSGGFEKIDLKDDGNFSSKSPIPHQSI